MSVGSKGQYMDDTPAVQLTPEFQERVDQLRPRWREQARGSLQGLQTLGITSYSQLAALLPSLRDDALVTAIWALPHFDKRRTVPVLLRLLRDPDPSLRGHAVIGLDMIGGPRAARAFVRHLESDPDPWVREKAAHGLGFLFNRRYFDLAFEPLLAALEKEHECPQVRAQAAEGLGNIIWCSDYRTGRYRRAQAALIRTLEDPAPEVHFWAAFALGTIRSRAALPKLRQLVASDNAFLAMWWKEAAEGTIRIGWTVGEEASDAVTCIRTGEWPDREPYAEL